MLNDATLARARKIVPPRTPQKPASATARTQAAGKAEALSALSSAGAVAAVSKSAAPTFQECRALFQMVAQCLRDACETDEAHEYSGESDRLLRIGSGIAFEAGAQVKAEHCELAAYDVAACINAARLIPGDTESAVRTALIDTAAAALASITENTPEKIVFTDVKRPSRPNRSTDMPTKEQVAEAYFDVTCWLGCAKGVLDLYAQDAGVEAIFGLRDLLDGYNEKFLLPVKTEDLGDFISGVLPDVSCNLARSLDLIYTVLEGGHDNACLHGVAYLLREAKAIADGKRLGDQEGAA